MPYPNEHACRLEPPGNVNIIGSLTLKHNGKRYRAIRGTLKSTGKAVLQALRYPKTIWSAKEARTHCKSKGGSFEAAAKSKAAAIPDSLVANDEGGSFLTVSGQEETDSGAKIQRFKKDILRVGEYIHPLFGWKLDVTEERLYHFAAAFKEMQANGVDVEVPLDHQMSAEDNLGYVIDMFVEGEVLFGIHEIRGEEAIDTVQRNKNVSVAIDREYTDGKGNAYGEAIIHSSVVQQPVVPEQDDFVLIAASQNAAQRKLPIFTLRKEQTMSMFTLEELKTLLGAGDDLTEDNALNRIKEALETRDTKIEELGKEKVEIQSKLDATKKATSQQLSIDPNLAEQMGATADAQLNLLVSSGKITPAVKDKLSAAMVGKTGHRNLIALSLREDNTPSVFSAVVEALTENDHVELGEQTKLQALSIGLEGSSEEDGKVKPDKEMGDAMVVGVGGKVKTT